MTPFHYDTITIKGVVMWRVWLRMPGCCVSMLSGFRPVSFEGMPA